MATLFGPQLRRRRLDALAPLPRGLAALVEECQFRGLAAELLEGLDAQEYFNKLRQEWDHRPVGRQRVARLMREQGLQGLPRRRFRVTTTSDSSLAVAPNHLAREFQVEPINHTWASDLTYLWTEQGWLYLAVILDLGSRRVVGWSLGEDLSTELPLRALRMALGHRTAAQLHHSDRGCQHASAAYRAELAKNQIECSMSRRGNCWDNAPVESFFSTLKRELVDRSPWQTRAQARADVFDYLEVFYNRQRRHSALGYLSPADHEASLVAA